MTRKFKAIALALVAVFAMSAVAASGAQAAEGFNWEEGTSLLTASAQERQIFTTNAGEIKCREVVGDAAVSGTGATSVETTSITYRETPENDNCETTLGSFATATIDMNGCNYLFHAGTTVEPGNTNRTQGTADIVCPTGKQIVVTSSTCTIDIGPQTGLGPVYYENTAVSPKDVDINPAITNIKYTQTKTTSFFSCGEGTFTNGTYKGKVTITGETSKGAQKSVWVE